MAQVGTYQRAPLAGDEAQYIDFVNLVIQAVITESAGPVAPAETYAHMVWLDTSTATPTLRRRNAANSDWLVELPVLGQAVWDGLTDATPALISPANLNGVLAGAIASRIYNIQTFTASGTWVKPANAQSGDKVIVQAIGGGGGGGRNNPVNNSAFRSGGGGGGGGGVIHLYQDIDELNASEQVLIGGGGNGRGSTGTGSNGGVTSFRPLSTDGCLRATGGSGGSTGFDNSFPPVSGGGATLRYLSENFNYGGETSGGGSSVSPLGGGGGGGAIRRDDSPLTNQGNGAPAQYGGAGGNGRVGGTAPAGNYPGGGGGGSVNGTSGAGADGFVRVWCMRESE